MLRAGLLAEQARRLPGDAAASARAVQAYREAEAQGAEPGLVRYALAALGDGATPPTSPAGYVRQLFDQYAPRFDEHLRDRLHYRTPELLVAAALAHALGTGAVVHAPGTGAVVHAPGTGPVTHAPMPGAVPQPSGLSVLDLGCGTGLCGPLLRPAAARLVGVDLSPKMLEQAQGRGYDELVCAEAVAYLLGQPAAFDLVLAADVVVYIGDLQPLFAAVWRALRPGGVFALSTELHTGEGFVLQPSRRYGHGLGYVDAVAQAQGFAGVARQREVLRQEHGTPVEGLLHVLRRAD